MHTLNSLTISAKRDTVLATLHKNREEHATIVAEARVGYVEKARAALSAKLDKLASGKIVSLLFSLEVPVDYTSVYDTAIRMLELHQGETVELNASQVRNLIQDEWDWTDQFYATNSTYSRNAHSKYKGSVDEE